MKKTLLATCLAGTMVVSSGCGLLLYPERQGQTSGKIDPVVVGLDMLGLVFFIVPGLVAFAIDYSSGTIYLPNSASSVDAAKTHSDKTVINQTYLNNHFDALKVENFTTKNAEQTLSHYFNQPISLSNPHNIAIKVEDITAEQLAAFGTMRTQY